MSRNERQGGALTRIPAVFALLIQIFTLVIVLGGALMLSALASIQMTVGVAALLQGVIAAALGRWRGTAPWWIVIHLIFPTGVILLLGAHLPSWLFLCAFLLLLALYWSTFRTQVPFYPSGRAVWRAVAALLPSHAPRVIDVGSGLGGLMIHLARVRPDGEYTGIEIAPLPWMVSRLRSSLTGVSARFLRGDYEKLDFGVYDVVFAYLSPAAMPALWRKAKSEMRPGSLLLSYEFAIPGAPAHDTLHPADHGPALYLWRF